MNAALRAGRQRGFTLIELLVVLAIVALLVSIAVPNYFVAERRARETVLRENLRVMRASLEAFMSDQGRYPVSLEELVDQRYLLRLPVDPITKTNRSWVAVPAQTGLDDPRTGVADVRSGASGTSVGGAAYGAL
jgi:prepilin-type N-terminal cleavage/methylation domain-containing protein